MLFYDLRNDALLLYLTQKLCDKMQQLDNGCINWLGEFNKTKLKPEYLCNFAENVTRYDVRRVLFQLQNPDMILPKNQKRYSVLTTCGNDLCIFEEHMVLQNRDEIWDADKIWQKLLAKGVDGDKLNDSPDHCLLWTGCVDDQGYGRVKVNAKSYLVHALSLALRDGLRDVPKKNQAEQLLVVRHKCTAKHCFRPSHLELGTHAQNSMDKERDGTQPRGEAHQSASITQEVAAEIKLSWRKPGTADFVSVKDRAVRFGVSVSLVYQIDCGNTWRELPGPRDELVARQVEQHRTHKMKVQQKLRSEGLSQAEYDRLVAKILQNIKAEFCSKDPSIVTPCSIWQGATRNDGYGVVSYKYCVFDTHVLVCERLLGKKPEGCVVRHLCGQKKCCAEDHLVIGTLSENRRDAILHGDSATKLSIENVRYIRENVKLDDKQSIETASRLLDICVLHVRAIVKGKYWGWIS